jgi:hypothetical protein
VGIPEFLRPLAFWLLVAIVSEWVATRKTYEWSPWLTATSLLTVLFRIYWIAWTVTFQIKDLTPIVDPETLRDKMLISLFLFFAAASFAPVATLGVRRVWIERDKCGRSLTVVRAVPVAAMTYLFLTTLILAVRVVSRLATSL